ncbi:MAG TPA: hypothetical protein VD837_17030 [Terriglobales bacterium]|nr:hypothetical protein [Terriglobales bacterium]
MSSILKDVRVKRALVVVGLVLIAAGLSVGLKALTIAGSVLALVGFVSAGGA